MNEHYDFYADTTHLFLSSHTDVGERLSVTLPSLHSAYLTWCKGRGCSPANRNWFGRYVRSYVRKTGGFLMLSKQRSNQTFYVGLALK